MEKDSMLVVYPREGLLTLQCKGLNFRDPMAGGGRSEGFSCEGHLSRGRCAYVECQDFVINKGFPPIRVL